MRNIERRSTMGLIEKEREREREGERGKWRDTKGRERTGESEI